MQSAGRVILLSDSATPAQIGGLRSQLGLDRPLPVQLELVKGSVQGKAFMENTRQITTWSATSGTGDPDGYLWRDWVPENAQQKNGWWTAERAAKYNQLGMQARSILDRNQRFDLYQQMLTEWETEAPGTTLYISKEAYGIKSTLDWTPYPLYCMDLRAYNFKVK